jgi:gluconate 2-dehydrogenase alpha chain
MTEPRPEVDVVVVGMGWAGGIISTELAKAGLSVVGLERGDNSSWRGNGYQDELRSRFRHEWAQDAAKETWTLRHNLRERALPIRRLGSFLPGTGVGGSGRFWSGGSTRFGPYAFRVRAETIERYGEEAIPEGSTIQDWGITYDELEPYYDRFEYAVGVSGKAGNIRGEIVPGGNPFEGPRSREYPLPPVKQGLGPRMFAETVRELGYHPHPRGAGILSQPYTNEDGVSRAGCTYNGYCMAYPCETGARADASVALLPTALRTGRFELRTHTNVFEVIHDGDRARGVRYYDESGEVVEQPASIVVLAAYTFNNVRLLLLSGLGTPYDPETGHGSVGKNYAYQTSAGGLALFAERTFRRYMGMTASSMMIDDFNADNFDHSGLGFIGGGEIMSVSSHALPISTQPVPPGTPAWGPAWKAAIREWFDRAVMVAGSGEVLSYREHHLDLDPSYRDAWGNPLLRITFDWRENERRTVAYLSERIAEIVRAMGADHLMVNRQLEPHYDVVRYQSTHNTGGAIMGADPATSAVNPWLQMWEAENVFVVGGSAFPQNPGYPPTETICALAYRAAEGIERYAERPAMLV